jgi:hypothetical protein
MQKAIRLVGTRRVHGSTQHLYRLSLKSDWAGMALEATKD